MIGIVATIRITEGADNAFETAFGELAAAVRANEPGNKLYQLTRSRTETGVYKVLEIYADQSAVDAHRASAHFKELGAKLGPSMAGRPEVEILDAVG